MYGNRKHTDSNGSGCSSNGDTVIIGQILEKNKSYFMNRFCSEATLPATDTLDAGDSITIYKDLALNFRPIIHFPNQKLWFDGKRQIDKYNYPADRIVLKLHWNGDSWQEVNYTAADSTAASTGKQYSITFVESDVSQKFIVPERVSSLSLYMYGNTGGAGGYGGTCWYSDGDIVYGGKGGYGGDAIILQKNVSVVPNDEVIIDIIKHKYDGNVGTAGENAGNDTDNEFSTNGEAGYRSSNIIVTFPTEKVTCGSGGGGGGGINGNRVDWIPIPGTSDGNARPGAKGSTGSVGDTKEPYTLSAGRLGTSGAGTTNGTVQITYTLDRD